MDNLSHKCAQSLEAYLGDPQAKTAIFSYKNSLTFDIQEAFPDDICAELNDWGLHRYYVPTEFGGDLDNYEQILMLIRLVARRDLTVAIGHGKTYLGAVCVWVSGTQEQATYLGQAICQGEIVSLALTERSHGSDILSNELTAELSGDGFLLNGEKWLINNANRSDNLTVFARTDTKGGSRGYSVFLVEKKHLTQPAYTCLKKIKTHGIRGADISGIQFNNAWISSKSLVGKLGYGLEIVLKSLQITRTLCASLSLGAADNALRLVYKFADNRQLYGKKLLEIPHSRQILLNAFSDLLICEVLGITSVRAIHVLSEQMSLISAFAKYFIPTRVEQMIEQLAILLGARGFLLKEFEYGRFQKLERDHRLVGLFDGNTLVNLQVIVNQLKSLAKLRQLSYIKQDARVVDIFTLTTKLSSWNREALSLTTRGQDSILNSLAQVESNKQGSHHLYAIQGYVNQIVTEIKKLDSEVLATDWVINAIPTRYFTLAQKYSLLYAAAACTQMWLYNHSSQQARLFQSIWDEGIWLRVCLERLLSQLNIPVNSCVGANRVLFEQLEQQYSNNLLFSLFPLKLSENSAMLSERESIL
jgi:alkylation response protein AidB-like acyl-CoA dehydrogenase